VIERALRARLGSVLLMVAASAALPVAILHSLEGSGKAPFGYTTHFIAIAAVSTMAGWAAIAVTVVGARRGDGRAVLVGTAFAAMSGLLAVHGLATEDILVGENDGLSGLAGAAALPVGAIVLAVAAAAPMRRPSSVRPLLALEAALLTTILALGALGLAMPSAVPELPKPGGPIAVAALVVSLALFANLAVHAVRTWTLTRRFADLLVVVGTVWLGVALIPQLLDKPWGWTWWLGHALEIAGVVLVGGPVALDLHRDAQSRPLTGDLRAADLVAREEAFLGPRVRALMVRLAEKDEYTEGHTRRVAMLAVQLGERVGLSPGRLRDLAIGGLLHDIGKLSTPDAILKKPGPLTGEERDAIALHPADGERLIVELGGFSGQVRRLVLDHHERLDGKGYPRGVGGPELDRETRILSVCDVFDALVSDRVYRSAWTETQAFELLAREAGTAFDSGCVEALAFVLADERAVRASVRRLGLEDRLEPAA
jgi:HD-GYP domain-containing protein (c-di-GMP phosphodiesterase class II)